MSNLEEIDPADEPRTYRQQSFPRRLSVARGGLDDALHHRLRPAVRPRDRGRRPRDRAHPRRDREAGDGHQPRRAGRAPGRATAIVSVDGGEPDGLDCGRRATSEAARARRSGSSSSATASSVPLDGRARAAPTPKASASGSSASRPDSRRTSARPHPWAATESVRGLGQLHGAHGQGARVVLLARPAQELRRPDRGPATGQGSTASKATGPSRWSAPPASPASWPRTTASPSCCCCSSASTSSSAIFNMIPLLPFDGGHVAIAVYERLRSRRGRRYHADVAKLLPLTSAVVVFLVLFGVPSSTSTSSARSPSSSGDVPAPEDPPDRPPASRRTRWPSAATRR